MKRITRTAPELIMQMFRGDQHLAERLAIEAMTSGYAGASHIDTLLTALHVLRFGAAIVEDDTATNVGRFAEIALAAIADRYKASGKVGATGEEMKALRMMQDYQEDWWKRQGGTTRRQAVDAVNRWHKQVMDARRRAA